MVRRAFDGWIIPVVIVAFASALWSVSPELSMRRAIAFALTIYVAAVMASVFSARDFLRLLALVLTLIVIASIVVELAGLRPGIGADDFIGDLAGETHWSGVFFTKNELARVSALQVFSCFVLWIDRAVNRRTLVVAMMLGVVALSNAQSAGANVFLGLALGAALLAGTYTLRKSLRIAAPFLAAGLLLIAFGFVYSNWLDSLLVFLGRDPTLTGRLVLWDYALSASAQRPVSGYGYAAFWGSPSGPAAGLNSHLRQVVPNAHNGYLEVMLGLGWVGLCLSIVWLLSLLRRGTGIARDNRVLGAWSCGLAVGLMAYCFSESVLISANSLWTIAPVVAMGQINMLRGER